MNRMLARTEGELKLFEQLDNDIDWPSPATGRPQSPAPGQSSFAQDGLPSVLHLLSCVSSLVLAAVLHSCMLLTGLCVPPDVPAWLRYTSAEATEALLASAKLKPTEVAQLRAAEAARAQGQGLEAAPGASESVSVAGPSKARRKSRPTVSFQVQSDHAPTSSAVCRLSLFSRRRLLLPLGVLSLQFCGCTCRCRRRPPWEPLRVRLMTQHMATQMTWKKRLLVSTLAKSG